jgi:hypothetical protein
MIYRFLEDAMDLETVRCRHALIVGAKLVFALEMAAYLWAITRIAPTGYANLWSLIENAPRLVLLELRAAMPAKERLPSILPIATRASFSQGQVGYFRRLFREMIL